MYETSCWTSKLQVPFIVKQVCIKLKMSVFGVFTMPDAKRRHRIMAFINILGFSYYTLMTATVTYLGLFEVVPLLCRQHHTKVIIHYTAIMFLFLNTVGNFVSCLTTNTSVKRLYVEFRGKLKLTADVKEQYEKFNMKTKLKCKRCDIRVPPRCHHCVLCNR